MAKPGAPTQGEFVDLPEMEWLKCRIDSAEMTESTYNGETKTQVKVVFKVLDPDYDGGQMNYWAGFSLHEKSKLRPLAEAVTGLSGEALYEKFDTDELVGAEIEVLGKNVTSVKDGQERTFLRPTMFRPVGGGRKRKPEAKPASGDDDDIDI